MTDAQMKAAAPAIVTLTWSEMLLAHAVAGHRNLTNLRNAVKPKYGQLPFSVENETLMLLGCRAEMAVAKYFNRYWSGAVGDYKAADVGDNIEVRSRSAVVPWRDLILHKEDKDDRPYILVVGDGAAMSLMGWIMGADGKREDWWRDGAKGRPAYFVPLVELRPMSELLIETLHTQVI